VEKIIIKQNNIHEGTMKGVNLGKACYHSAQNIPASLLLPKHIKIILPPLSYE
jgi:hypothetical protein